MIAFTDYPITELGDTPYVEAPIRQVSVVYYDGEEYCLVEVAGMLLKYIKAGYLYEQYGRNGDVPVIQVHKAPFVQVHKTVF
jgi:hypothetical protein